jgi:hypothetical protein
MDRDDLDERLRRAAAPEPAAVDRVVTAALANDDSDAASQARRSRASTSFGWPRGVAMFATCLVAVVAFGAWWAARQPAAPASDYRVDALPAPLPDEAHRTEAPLAPAPERGGGLQAVPPVARDGVYRIDAIPSVAPSRVIRVTASDGATWILSTNAVEELPAGKAIVVGGGEAR